MEISLLQMEISLLRDRKGATHASHKLFLELMVKIAAYRCQEHGQEPLDEPVTAQGAGLEVEAKSTQRWGQSWSQVLSRCKLCFNLPATELRNPGNYTRRQEYLVERSSENHSKNRSKWALHLSVCSNSLFAKIQTTPQKRFVTVANEQRSSGEEVFNTAFQFTQVQEASLARLAYQTSFDGRVKGKTKEQIGEEYCTCYGIGHFAAGHALLLLSGGGSVETLRSTGVKDSDVVFAGTGCSTVASLILSHKVGWVVRSLAEPDYEHVIRDSRHGLERAADRLFKKGLIKEIPFCVRKGTSGKYLAILETVADLFCETRQFLNYMNGKGHVRKSAQAERGATKKVIKKGTAAKKGTQRK